MGSENPTTDNQQHANANPKRLDDHRLDESVAKIVTSILDIDRTRHLSTFPMPHRSDVVACMKKLGTVLFPGFVGERELNQQSLHKHVDSVIKEVAAELYQHISNAYCYENYLDENRSTTNTDSENCDDRASTVVQSFFEKIPKIRHLLSLDVQAAYDGDPAARNTDEVIASFPGIRALMMHRMVHELQRMDVPLLPRMLNEYIHSQTGIDIHPGARIGQSFFIDHGTGVVIGETTVIGDHCKIYHGVTLGAKSFKRDQHGRLMRGTKRHPTLEDHVTVYAGASILGGDTIIGAGCVISGGVFLTESVPPGHMVHGPKASLTLRSNPQMPPTNFNI